jgi:hypothetical protein
MARLIMQDENGRSPIYIFKYKIYANVSKALG